MESHREATRNSGDDRAGFLPERMYGNRPGRSHGFEWQTQEENRRCVAVRNYSFSTRCRLPDRKVSVTKDYSGGQRERASTSRMREQIREQLDQ